MNHHEPVADRRPHTRDFSQTSRDDLGLAVRRAREAVSLTWNQLANTAKIGRTSLFKLEKGEPVGAPVYEAVARALPGWTEDTPVQILGGAAPPATGQVTASTAAAEPARVPSVDLHDLLRRIEAGEDPDLDQVIQPRTDFEREVLSLPSIAVSTYQKVSLIIIHRGNLTIPKRDVPPSSGHRTAG